MKLVLTIDHLIREAKILCNFMSEKNHPELLSITDEVMELSLNGTSLINGLKEHVDIESRYVFPLIKSSMFKSPVITDSEKYVIVTQKKIREDTSHIAIDSPKIWHYLTSHKEHFLKRKSSIYKDAPDFSMFGIGDYSYASYKVSVSGFYKKPLFSVLASPDSIPIMTDDTSYFICFPTYDSAYVAMLILNSTCVQHFLSTIAFLDAKRPYTKKVLERIGFYKKILSVAIGGNPLPLGGGRKPCKLLQKTLFCATIYT